MFGSYPFGAGYLGQGPALGLLLPSVGEILLLSAGDSNLAIHAGSSDMRGAAGDSSITRINAGSSDARLVAGDSLISSLGAGD